jgi:hypothetical protein
MATFESRRHNPGAEKLLDAFSIKCTSEFKSLIAMVAAAEGIDASEFVRQAVEKEISRRRSMYEAWHVAFGNSKGNEE